ncbi:hypothetical protein LTR08_003109 [Meristemomyces frigidus]|nr:hypothetical protein LTR08_003109 [Meristemomyces frigidus]
MLVGLVSTLSLASVALALSPSYNSCPAQPRNVALKNNTHLPDPFTFEDGQKVKTKQQWQCRREELKSLFEEYELGTLPGPPEHLSASLNASNLTITAATNGATISFSVNITLPTTGKAPFPAVIAFDGLSIPVPSNVATIVFAVSAFGVQNDPSSRDVGTFYDLFGHNATASALMAWAWGVGRIIDALEITPSAKINTKKLAVTGCSRNGKGALVAGAFNDRIALTIPQESGSGGTSCWRISDAMLRDNQSTQTASEIVGENVWESLSFDQFANDTDLLPFDHHELLGLVAPRGLIVIDNSDYLWLGPESSWGCTGAARLIYSALGVTDNIGLSNVANHSHCAFPMARELPDLMAFYDKFLLNQPANTDIFYAVPNITLTVGDLAYWANWKVPKLS